MRYLILLLASYLPFLHSSAQNGVLVGTVQLNPNNLTSIMDRDFNAQLVSSGVSLDPPPNSRGSLFFNDDWNKGFVLMKGNQIAKDVSIRFNSYTNQIFFRKGDQILVLDASIPVIGFGLEGGNDNPGKTTVFLNGYPAIEGRTPTSFYEVVAYGRLSLLKYHSKKIMEEKDQNRVPIKAVIDADYWCVYDSTTNTMTDIKHNKNSLLESLPSYAASIRSLLDEKKLKLRSDEEWPVLFDALNSHSY